MVHIVGKAVIEDGPGRSKEKDGSCSGLTVGTEVVVGAYGLLEKQ